VNFLRKFKTWEIPSKIEQIITSCPSKNNKNIKKREKRTDKATKK
jgi:hypothetical protein